MNIINWVNDFWAKRLNVYFFIETIELHKKFQNHIHLENNVEPINIYFKKDYQKLLIQNITRQFNHNYFNNSAGGYHKIYQRKIIFHNCNFVYKKYEISKDVMKILLLMMNKMYWRYFHEIISTVNEICICYDKNEIKF